MLVQPQIIDQPLYPDSDGNPMSDNTEQFRWIVMIKENLEIIFADDPNVFVAGDLLWYPVEGIGESTAPDVLVAFGRPKGRRGSYKQWEEAGIPPQVVFEILSPSNKDRRGKDSLAMKLEFYERHGVQEYYIYDPDDFILEGRLRQGDRLVLIAPINGWVSPYVGIRFEWEVGQEMKVYRPDGQRFLSPLEIEQRARSAEQRARSAEQRAEQLAERLRALGIDPEIE